MGLTINQADIEAMLAKSNVSGIVKNLASQTSTQFSNIFLILFTVAFMLMESQFMHSKVQKILSKSKINLEDGMQIISKINTYFIIKVKNFIGNITLGTCRALVLRHSLLLPLGCTGFFP